MGSLLLIGSSISCLRQQRRTMKKWVLRMPCSVENRVPSSISDDTGIAVVFNYLWPPIKELYPQRDENG